MLQRIEALHPEDLFLPLARRPKTGVYFLRINEYSEAIRDLVWKFHEEARARGVIIEDRINNPDERQLSYYSDVLGSSFEPNAAFIRAALQKWMPRLSDKNRIEFSDALEKQLSELKKAGKSDSIIKNTYIKLMCWLYYRFERLVPFLGGENPPKVLYFGSGITSHELILLRIISSLGSDILFLETGPDSDYLRLDPSSAWSQKMPVNQGKPFPTDFTLKQLRKEMAVKPGGGPGTMPQQRPGNRPAPVQPQPVRQGSVQSPLNPAVRQPQNPVVPRPQNPMTGRPQAGQPVRPGTVPSPGQPGRDPRQAVRPSMIPSQKPLNAEERFAPPARTACTNAWMSRAEMNEILTPPVSRGNDHRLFYNAFIRMTGAADKLTYMNELYQLYQHLTTNRREILVIDGEIPKPEPEELQKIRRRNYRTPDEMIVDLAGNLPSSAQVELQKEMQRAFVRTMKRLSESETNLNRLLVKGVYILCWIQRYQSQLFRGWKETDVPCFIKMGGCETDTEAFYMILLSQLPVDVLILAPNLNQVCMLQDERLLEIRGPESLPDMKFPKQKGSVQMRTAASHAERDLDTVLYTGSGMYRNQQFSRAEAITLQTTYDEISILWDQDLKYRPSFSTTEQMVSIPVIWAKVNGVENGKVHQYWNTIKTLKEAKDTLLFTQFPIIPPGGGSNSYQPLAVKGIKSERLKTAEIKAARNYPFALLREEMQDHIFEQIQRMLDQRIIKGTFVNGTEYTVLSTILNLNKELIRLIQGFDFTKKNPKVVIIHTRDRSPSLEDAIFLTFLNMIGFDIVQFVPTGYVTIEMFLNDNYPVEHQIGDYLYDLTVPDFSTLAPLKSHSWLNNILKRGN